MINSFSGEYAFLSNFYQCEIKLDGGIYPSVEHAFQAAKTLDRDIRATIRNAATCREAKALGQKVDLRSDWESAKYDIMDEILARKFHDHDLAVKLVSTGPHLLVEGNTWHDQFWGSCSCSKHVGIAGYNALGILLMHRRLKVGTRWPSSKST